MTETFVFDSSGLFYLASPRGMLYAKAYGFYEVNSNKVILNTILNKHSLIWKLDDKQPAKQIDFVVRDALFESGNLTANYTLISQNGLEIYYSLFESLPKWKNLDKIGNSDTLFLVSTYNDLRASTGISIGKDSLYTYTFYVFHQEVNSILLNKEVLEWKRGKLWWKGKPLKTIFKTSDNIVKFTLKKEETLNLIFNMLKQESGVPPQKPDNQ